MEKTRQAEAQHKGAQPEGEDFKAHLGLDWVETGLDEKRRGEDNQAKSTESR